MLLFSVNHYNVYLLVLLRMAAFVATSPLISVSSWPNIAKLGLAAYLALITVPSVSTVVPSPFTDPGSYILLALNETIAGMLIGFTATVLFSAVTIAGQVFDVQIGFGSAVLYNPQESQSTGITSNMNSLLFTLFFLGMNGLDGLMLAILNSYRFIPLGKLSFPSTMWEFLVHALDLAMTLAIQFAAPLIVALLLTDVTFALLSRTVPQMNVFVVELPAKLFVGLALYAAAMPGVVYVMGQVFSTLFREVNSLLQVLGG